MQQPPQFVIKKREPTPSDLQPIYRLVGAKLTNYFAQHVCLVRECRSGLQGCLIVKQTKMGEEWSDALILVPDAAQYTEVLERPEYSAALDLIKTAYRKEHADRLGGNLKELCDEGFDSRVFTQQNLEDLVTGLRELSRTARMQGRQVAPKEMDELINRFEKTPPIIWNPVVLSSGLASKQFGENWAILQKWQEWDRQQFLCPQCAEEYYGEPQNRKQVDVFRKRLKYLGLPLWVTNTKAMRQEQRRLRSLIPKAELEARREAKRLKKQSFYH